MYEKPNLEGQNLVVMDGQGTIFLIPMLLVVLKNPSHLDTPLAQPFVTNESLFGVLAYIEKTNEGLLKYKMSYWNVFVLAKKSFNMKSFLSRRIKKHKPQFINIRFLT